MPTKETAHKVCSVCGVKIPIHAKNNRCLNHGGSYVATDCFAYVPNANYPNNPANGDCYALKELYCRNEKCNFYKPGCSCGEIQTPQPQQATTPKNHFNDGKAVPIIATDIHTGEEQKFKSQGRAAEALGIPQTLISRCVLGKVPQVSGYKFRTAEKDEETV